MDLALPDAFDRAARVPRVQFLSELMARLRGIPGVEEVGGSSALPLATGISSDGSYAVLNPRQHAGNASKRDGIGRADLQHAGFQRGGRRESIRWWHCGMSRRG